MKRWVILRADGSILRVGPARDDAFGEHRRQQNGGSDLAKAHKFVQQALQIPQRRHRHLEDERIRAGASLVQIYTSYIYGGPDLPRRILSGIDRYLEKNSMRMPDLIGADAR